MAVALLPLVGACGGQSSGGRAVGPSLGDEARVETAATALLELLPAGADVVLEVDLARLRANSAVGPAVAELSARWTAAREREPGAGVDVADLLAADLVVAAVYRFGRDDAATLLVWRGGAAPAAGAANVDTLDDGTRFFAPPALRDRVRLLAAGAVGAGESLAADPAFLALRDLAMPVRAPGASLRLTARLDRDARIAGAGQLRVDELPASVSLWLDVADDLAAVALLGADDAAGAARLADAVHSTVADLRRLPTLRDPLYKLRTAAAGATLRITWVVGPKALSAWVGTVLSH